MAETTAPSSPGSRWSAGVLLTAYLVALALIAFWPEPVDRGAVGLLDRIERYLPWATYGRIEFSANVVLFVPLGWLLSILLSRTRYLVLPIGLLATIVIETVQGDLLSQRAFDISDILANTAGVCIGMLLAALGERLTRRRPTGRIPSG
jgi:VanZ family protein